MRCRNKVGVIVAVLWLAGCAATPAQRQTAGATDTAHAVGPQFDQALGLMHAQHYSQAIPLLEPLNKARPDSQLVAVNLAIAQSRSDHDAQAEPLLHRLLAQYPADAVAWNELGMLQRRAGQFAAAQHSYEQALAANAAYADAELNLAILYDLYLQQPAQALPHYRRYQTLATTPDKRVSLWIAELSKMAISSAKDSQQP